MLLGHHPRHAPTSSAYGGITHYATPSQTIQLQISTHPVSGRRPQDSPTTPHTQPLPSITRTRFNHHPLSLATTHGISSPTGTEMFHFPASPPTPYTIQMQVTRHNSCRVPPFGNPRITARQPAPRGISQATASFIGPRCQGIHRTLIKTNNTQNNTTHGARATRTTPARAARRTKQENKQTGDRTAQFTIPRPPADARVHYAVHNQPAHNPRPPQKRQEEAQGARTPGRTAPEPDSMPRPPTPPPPPGGDPDGPRTRRKAGDQKGGRTPGPAPRRRTRAPSARGNNEPLRKEVIQPHLPVRLPCYDFVPITGPAFDRSPWGHGLRASPTFMT